MVRQYVDVLAERRHAMIVRSNERRWMLVEADLQSVQTLKSSASLLYPALLSIARHIVNSISFSFSRFGHNVSCKWQSYSASLIDLVLVGASICLW